MLPLWPFFAFLMALVAAFCAPLLALIRYASANDLHSHVLLIPLVTAYLLYIDRSSLPATRRPAPGLALIPLVAALSALTISFSNALPSAGSNERLALVTFAFVLFLWAGAFIFLGRQWMSAAAFPMAFLIFLVPLPDPVVNLLENVSKLASAEAAALYFELAGTPVLRDGTVFRLPGLMIEVAQECSGIRSSWVLFITSLLAAHLFLRSPWRRAALVAMVFPLAIARNGFRIFVIGELCIRVGNHMIDSPIHHKGGPIFFALSLLPLFAFLWWLRRGEEEKQSPLISPQPITNPVQ